MSVILDPITLTQELIACRSITPYDDNAMTVVCNALKSLNFTCIPLDCGVVKNLYARIGSSVKNNLAFAGHIDVVPPGKGWLYDPFQGRIVQGNLYGRGACDMKSALCAFIAAISRYLSKTMKLPGAISLLITGNEEEASNDGTEKIVQWLKENRENISMCIVGEPTSEEILGDVIKIGRRGSITFTLEVIGEQGHVAYAQYANNAIDTLVKILYVLNNTVLDKGSKCFQPSTCTVTTIDVNNEASNVIPARACCRFNIRFNDLHTIQGLKKMVKTIVEKFTTNYTLHTKTSALCFMNQPSTLLTILQHAIQSVTKMVSRVSTSGGTSDARFIYKLCPVVEFGLLNKTAHKVNECVAVDDIHALTRIYELSLEQFFTSLA